ncbi:MAG: toprim domain-containing protein [Candidatus Enterenecus sp.]
MIRIKEAIVVEGRYDKNTLSQAVDAVILETSGFSVFKDSEKLALLRRLAQKQGLIVLTDSDGAGFVIRNYIKGAIPPEQVKHAYIPDVYGKERRKRAPGKEGKLGVEGMSPEVLVQALLRAGATVEGEEAAAPRGQLTPADLFALGLTGTPDAAQRRAALLKALELPQHMSAKALLTVLNALYAPEELAQLMKSEGLL